MSDNIDVHFKDTQEYQLNFDEAISATDTRVNISSQGSEVISNAEDLNFGSNFNVADDGDNTVTVTLSGSTYSDEQAQDAVGTIMSGSGATSVTYDDGANTITISSTDTDTTDHSQLTNVQSDQHHVKYSDSDAILAINNDADHGSTASHNYFSGSHQDLTNINSDDHHVKYTDEEAQDAVGTIIQGSGATSVTYDDAGNSITISSTDNDTQLTTEEVEDIVGALIINGTNTTATYDDANGELQIDATDTDTQLSQEEVQDDAWNVLTGAQTLITVSYDDANNEVDFTVNDDLSQYDNSSSGFITSITGEDIGDLSNVTISSVTSGELLKYNGSNWVNNTLSEAGIAATGHTHTLTDITDSGTLAGLNSVSASEIDNNAVTEPKLNASNAPSSGNKLAWNGSQLEWQTVTAGNTNNKVYHGSFVINSTGNINITGLPFAPNQVQFKASLPVDAESLAGKAGDSASDDTGFAGNMFGFARQSDGVQKAMSTGGSGASINNIRYGADDTKAIYATYGDADGNEVAQITGTVSSWNSDGFTVNIGEYSGTSAGFAGQVVHYVAFKNEELATTATDVSDSGTQVVTSAGDINFGSNLSVTDDGDNTVTVDASGSSYTDEDAQDAVGTIMTGSGATSVTYDDGANTITISSTDNDTTYSAGTGLSLSSTTFSLNASTSDLNDAASPNATAAGQTLIWNATNSQFENATLTGGTNVSITEGDASITIDATDTDTTYTAGDGLSLSGTTFNVDVSQFAGSGLQDDGAENLELVNNSVTVAGNTVSLGESTGVAANDLSDVSTSTESAGQVLIWHNTNEQYQNAFITAGTGLSSITDNASFTLDINAGDGIQILSDNVAVDVSQFAGNGLEDDGSENLQIQERVHYDPGMEQLSASLSNVEFKRIIVPSGSQFVLEQLAFPVKGGTSDANISVNVYDVGAASQIDSVTGGSRSTTGGTAGTGNDVIVRINTDSGWDPSTEAAEPIVKGRIE